MSIYKDYYIYAYLREDNTPYYIGKGRNRRAYSSNRLIKKPNDKNKIKIFMKNLDENESYQWEYFWIKALGRKDNGTGILANLTDGGRGGSSGIIKKISEETRQRMRESKKNISKETREKIRLSKLGTKFSQESKNKMSISHKNKIPWNKGKILSEIEKNKINYIFESCIYCGVKQRKHHITMWHNNNCKNRH